MARRVITEDIYARLLEAFRLQPGGVTNAALHAGVGKDFAARAWHKGWVNDFPWATPIKFTVEAEERGARAGRERFEATVATAAADAATDAAKQRTMEAILARTHAESSVIASKELSAMFGAFATGMEKVRRWLETYEPASEKGVSRAIDMYERLVRAHKMAVETAIKVMELERKRLGQPEKHLGLTISADDEKGAEELFEELFEIERQLAAEIGRVREAKAAGVPLTVILGGKADGN